MKRKSRSSSKNREGDNSKPRKKRKIDYTITSMDAHSASFKKFYSSQNLCENHHEFQNFLSTLRQPLPLTFRINATLHPNIIKAIQTRILKYFGPMIESYKIDLNKFKISLNNRRLEHLRKEETGRFEGVIEKIEKENEEISKWSENILEAPKVLPWYPKNLGFQLNISKNLFQKHPQLKEFRQWIVMHTSKGNMSRQEAVSMIPPLVFSISPSDKILDMCAAPGSKTAQLLEYLTGDQKIPLTGFVVANDLNKKRCQTLVHQQNRLGWLCRNLLVTNHDATVFPNISPVKSERIEYDKILCDVMCSGDGTLRKQPDIWKKWKYNGCWSLHEMQIRCVMRAFELLKNGGQLVYSTCSMHPLEDEAVVCEAIRRSGNQLKVVNTEEKLPGLNYSQGMNFWKVMDEDGNEIVSYEDGVSKDIPRLRKSMFPPSKNEVLEFNLRNCVRVLPHQNDTGGFFITLLQKVLKEENIKKVERVEFNEKSSINAPPPNINQDKKNRFVHQSFVPLSEKIMDRILKFYGMDEKLFGNNLFHHVDPESSNKRKQKKDDEINLLNRKEEVIYHRRINYHSSLDSRKILMLNEIHKKWNLLYAGVKAFEVDRDKSKYRMTQVGCDCFSKFMNNDRIIEVQRATFNQFLNYGGVSISKLKEFSILTNEEMKWVESVEAGSFVARLIEDDRPNDLLMYKIGTKITRSISKTRIDNVKLQLNIKI